MNKKSKTTHNMSIIKKHIKTPSKSFKPSTQVTAPATPASNKGFQTFNSSHIKTPSKSF